MNNPDVLREALTNMILAELGLENLRSEVEQRVEVYLQRIRDTKSKIKDVLGE